MLVAGAVVLNEFILRGALETATAAAVVAAVMVVLGMVVF